MSGSSEPAQCNSRTAQFGNVAAGKSHCGCVASFAIYFTRQHLATLLPTAGRRVAGTRSPNSRGRVPRLLSPAAADQFVSTPLTLKEHS
jgi:hypothetical protein